MGAPRTAFARQVSLFLRIIVIIIITCHQIILVRREFMNLTAFFLTHLRFMSNWQVGCVSNDAAPYSQAV